MCVYLGVRVGGPILGGWGGGVELEWFKWFKYLHVLYMYLPTTCTYLAVCTLCTPGRVNGEGKRVLEIKKVIR